MNKRSTGQIEKDVRKVTKLIREGCTEDEIIEQLGLTKSQFEITLKYGFRPKEARNARRILRVAKERRESQGVTEANQEPQGENETPEKIEKEIPDLSVQTDGNIQSVLIDTSIINSIGIIDVLRKIENAVFIFPTIVIEELDSLTGKPSFQGKNARELLSLALEDNSMVLPAAKTANLNGWSGQDKDSLIIQTALNLQNQKIVVYSSDKTLTLKAKSLGMGYVYVKSDANPSMPYEHRSVVNMESVKEEQQLDEGLFKSKEAVNQPGMIVIRKFKSFHYIPHSNEFPCYFKFRNGKASLMNKQIFIREGDVIYRVFSDKIEKLIVKHLGSSNSYNVDILCRGVFSIEYEEMDTDQMAILASELG